MAAVADARAAARARAPAHLLLGAALVGTALLGHGLAFGVVPVAAWPAAGATIAAAGAGWALWAAWLLRAADTAARAAAAEGEPALSAAARSAGPAVLVEEGPFRVGRNPMLLGTAVAMAGSALAVGVPLLAAAGAALIAIAARWLVPHEEARLRQRFGGWYSDYAARVRRWL